MRKTFLLVALMAITALLFTAFSPGPSALSSYQDPTPTTGDGNQDGQSDQDDQSGQIDQSGTGGQVGQSSSPFGGLAGFETAPGGNPHPWLLSQVVNLPLLDNRENVVGTAQGFVVDALTGSIVFVVVADGASAGTDQNAQQSIPQTGGTGDTDQSGQQATPTVGTSGETDSSGDASGSDDQAGQEASPTTDASGAGSGETSDQTGQQATPTQDASGGTADSGDAGDQSSQAGTASGNVVLLPWGAVDLNASIFPDNNPNTPVGQRAFYLAIGRGFYDQAPRMARSDVDSMVAGAGDQSGSLAFWDDMGIPVTGGGFDNQSNQDVTSGQGDVGDQAGQQATATPDASGETGSDTGQQATPTPDASDGTEGTEGSGDTSGQVGGIGDQTGQDNLNTEQNRSIFVDSPDDLNVVTLEGQELGDTVDVILHPNRGSMMYVLLSHGGTISLNQGDMNQSGGGDTGDSGQSGAGDTGDTGSDAGDQTGQQATPTGDASGSAGDQSAQEATPTVDPSGASGTGDSGDQSGQAGGTDDGGLVVGELFTEGNEACLLAIPWTALDWANINNVSATSQSAAGGEDQSGGTSGQSGTGDTTGGAGDSGDQSGQQATPTPDASGSTGGTDTSGSAGSTNDQSGQTDTNGPFNVAIKWRTQLLNGVPCFDVDQFPNLFGVNWDFNINDFWNNLGQGAGGNNGAGAADDNGSGDDDSGGTDAGDAGGDNSGNGDDSSGDDIDDGNDDTGSGGG